MARLVDLSLLKVTSIANLAATNKLNPCEPMVLSNASDIKQVLGTTKPSKRLAISNNDSIKTSGIVAGDLDQLATVDEVNSALVGGTVVVTSLQDATLFTKPYAFVALSANSSINATSYVNIKKETQYMFTVRNVSGTDVTVPIPTLIGATIDGVLVADSLRPTSLASASYSLVIPTLKAFEISLLLTNGPSGYVTIWEVGESLDWL